MENSKVPKKKTVSENYSQTEQGEKHCSYRNISNKQIQSTAEDI